MTATRRDFIKTTSISALAAGAIASNGQSANDTIRIGVAGVHGRGKDHIRSFAKQDNVDVVAICDIDEDVLDNVAGELKEHLKQPVKLFTDFRKMLEDESIDAVSIATPNHWHSLMGIWACQAGKDVYVEKPCSHNLHEGKKLVEAQNKYNRIVQHGTQSRSVAAFREGMQLLHEGYLGEVYYAKGLCYKRRDTIGKTPNASAPEGVHYDLWKGPAPDRPFSQNRYHYQWHWQWDYGNGDIGNQGVHEMDVARWGLGVEFPSLVSSIGGHFMFKDDQQTPNTMVSTFKFPNENKMLVFEVRHWYSPNEIDVNDQKNVIGTQFLGSEGYMVTDGYGRYRTYLGDKREPGKSNQSEFTHFENFIEAVRTRKQEDLNAPIREGHISAGMCHLANTSYYMERMLRFDPIAETVINDSEAQDFLVGKYRTPFAVPDEI
jgi:predicted dehydrogenase